ncbi:MAG: ral L-amino acid transport system permease protein, partial [Variibacter sp.]|nr:ral L-amino acid transport system permease protein [Variibacter sp.]
MGVDRTAMDWIEPEHGVAYVRDVPVESAPAPVTIRGPIGWLRANFFATPFDIVLTVVMALLVLWIVPPLLDFMIFDAVWSGKDREACLATPQHPVVGACWAFVRDRFAYFIYGSYPLSERWRVDIFFVMLAIGIVWMLKLSAPRRDIGSFYFFVVVPIASFILLAGWPLIGLRKVDTSLWGGLLVTIVV